jgi:hypothetical protein
MQAIPLGLAARPLTVRPLTVGHDQKATPAP